MSASKNHKNDCDIFMTIKDTEERSISAMHCSDVICNPETAKLNDEVQYRWNNKKYYDILRFVHENADLCVKEANLLTAERKQQDKAVAKAAKGGSFDASKPRQAKRKWKERIQGAFNKPKKSEDEVKSKKKSAKIGRDKGQSRDNVYGKRLINDNEDLSDTDSQPFPPIAQCN